MPFSSQAQWRACFAKQRAGTNGSWDCSEFAHATRRAFRKLPQHKKRAAAQLLIKLAGKLPRIIKKPNSGLLHKPPASGLVNPPKSPDSQELDAAGKLLLKNPHLVPSAERGDIRQHMGQVTANRQNLLEHDTFELINRFRRRVGDLWKKHDKKILGGGLLAGGIGTGVALSRPDDQSEVTSASAVKPPAPTTAPDPAVAAEQSRLQQIEGQLAENVSRITAAGNQPAAGTPTPSPAAGTTPGAAGNTPTTAKTPPGSLLQQFLAQPKWQQALLAAGLVGGGMGLYSVVDRLRQRPGQSRRRRSRPNPYDQAYRPLGQQVKASELNWGAGWLLARALARQPKQAAQDLGQLARALPVMPLRLAVKLACPRLEPQAQRDLQQALVKEAVAEFYRLVQLNGPPRIPSRHGHQLASPTARTGRPS